MRKLQSVNEVQLKYGRINTVLQLVAIIRLILFSNIQHNYSNDFVLFICTSSVYCIEVEKNVHKLLF